MKLVMAVIHDEDAYNVMDLLNEEGFSVTKLASTGGFLRSGNTTLIAGVDDDKVEKISSIIEKNCKARKQMTTANASPVNAKDGFIPYPIEVVIGGATIFVLDIETFKKI